ncbi:hypothetical protein PG994_004875 [Apiospora phragmitis]|uniref:Class II aldolase/adducin N-terminal domain-containing protein n=1 Tax=Apiospora phragmitis TaxID=2905665 RepID=A0ABR1VRU6_9PEZI
MSPSAVNEIESKENASPGKAKAGSPPQVQSMGKTKDGRTLRVRKYPSFDKPESERTYRKQHLAAAFRVFADRGFDEGVAGHISVRDPILTDHFYSLRFYKSHAIYDSFGGVVVDRAEGDRIARALGPHNKAVILQNHGVLTVGQTVDEAAFWFLSLERTCQAQLLADAAAAAGYAKKYIDEEEARYAVQELGGPEKGWLAFQPYYDEQVAKTGGSFLK